MDPSIDSPNRIGGTVGAILTCPLEIAKTRLQSSLYTPTATTPAAARTTLWQPVVHVQETLALLRHLYVHEGGVPALFRGLGPNLVGVMPARAVYFGAYTWFKDGLTAYATRAGDGAAVVGSGVHGVAAMGAGVVTATATAPIWLVKTRMQLQPAAAAATPAEAAPAHAAPASLRAHLHTRVDAGAAPSQRYRSSWACAREVAQREGLRGFYKGLGASYLGVAEGTLQWVLYERMKRRHAARATPTAPWGEVFLMAGAAKLIAAVATYPHEVQHNTDIDR